ncbi:hypothetical protein SI65_09002 [Aspergillus cristatus]|uniref:Uncharacterized protein n=1 Tax=Aspergillus cristatus TaxID=573508 RepID=A0A1E3B4E8_ASPCR|nr:hypothetical protein SI65_09002 [Aspergillus cristatus]
MARSEILSQLQAENGRQRSMIDEFVAANATYRQCLYAEQNTHAYTRQALVEARRLHLGMESTIHHLQRDIFNSQAAHVATQHVLGLEKRQLAEMAAELDRTQRKFQLVDSLVDTMLLEEDSDLELPDRSRQVTDLILSLEANMERKYQDILQKREERIMELERLLEYSDRKDGRF